MKIMAKFGGIKKNFMLIPLDDEPGSPVLRLNLGISDLTKKGVALRSRLIEVKADFDNIEANAEGAEKVNALWKDVIETFMNKGAYKTVVDYISGGEEIDPVDLAISVAPLALYVLNEVMGRISIKEDKLLVKYLGANDEADVI